MGQKIKRWLYQNIVPMATGIIMLAASTGPEEATSNIAGWLDYIGVSMVPKWAMAKSADNWAFKISFGVFVAWIVFKAWLYLKDKLQIQNPLQLGFQSISRALSNPDSKIRILCVLLMVSGLWVLSLQMRIKHLEVEMIRYVFPRELTQEQIEIFGEYLAKHSEPHDVIIKYVQGDMESARYAEDFAKAFRAGKWLPREEPISPARITCKKAKENDPPILCASDLQEMLNHLNAVTIELYGSLQPVPSTAKEKANAPRAVDDALRNAVYSFHIRGIIPPGGIHEPGGNAEIAKLLEKHKDPIAVVFIGIRQRDKLAVFPPRDLGDSRQSDYRDEDWN